MLMAEDVKGAIAEVESEIGEAREAMVDAGVLLDAQRDPRWAVRRAATRLRTAAALLEARAGDGFDDGE